MKKINLKSFDEEEDGFVISSIEDDVMDVKTPLDKSQFEAAVVASEPGEKVRISFAKFAHLVARSDLDQVIDANANAEVIIGTDLLAELATPSEEEEEKKIPVIFSVGLVIGIVLTYILFKYL